MLERLQIFLDQGVGNRAFANCGSDAMIGSIAHIACRKNAWDAGL